MNYYSGGGPWSVGHFWSLAVEEQFYFLWPVSIVFFGIAPSRKALYWIILAAPLLRFVLFPWKQDLGTIYGTMFPTACDAIAVGCLWAFLRRSLHEQNLYLSLLRRNWHCVVLPAALLLEAVLPARLAVSLGSAIVNLAVAFMIDGFITFDFNRAGRILNSWILRQIGVMSYSIYLWQQVFLNPEQHTAWTRLPGSIVLALSCATASYFLVEKPVLAFSRRRESEGSGQLVEAIAGSKTSVMQ
jgi:peptidoglycan/LPS O-acetylase OafA/YrhL